MPIGRTPKKSSCYKFCKSDFNIAYFEKVIISMSVVNDIFSTLILLNLILTDLKFNCPNYIPDPNLILTLTVTKKS